MPVGDVLFDDFIRYVEQCERSVASKDRLLQYVDKRHAAYVGRAVRFPQYYVYEQPDESGKAVVVEMKPWGDRFQLIADRYCAADELSAKVLRQMRGKILEEHPGEVDGLTVARAHELLSGEHGSDQKTKTRARKGDAKLKIISALDSLVNAGEWGKTDPEIYRLAVVSRSTFSALVKRDELVRKHLEYYHNRGIGKRPPDPNDL
jgi:hypothetical protein